MTDIDDAILEIVRENIGDLEDSILDMVGEAGYLKDALDGDDVEAIVRNVTNNGDLAEELMSLAGSLPDRRENYCHFGVAMEQVAYKLVTRNPDFTQWVEQKVGDMLERPLAAAPGPSSTVRRAMLYKERAGAGTELRTTEGGPVYLVGPMLGSRAYDMMQKLEGWTVLWAHEEAEAFLAGAPLSGLS